MVYLHKGILLCGNKNNGILKYLGKWMELDETILNEVTQSQKEEQGMYLLIYGF